MVAIGPPIPKRRDAEKGRPQRFSPANYVIVDRLDAGQRPRYGSLQAEYTSRQVLHALDAARRQRWWYVGHAR